MTTDIDSFIRVIEGLDEEQLKRDIADLQEQQRQLMIELNKRIDALAVKRRWAQQKQPGSSGALPAFGVEQDALERVRIHSPQGGSAITADQITGLTLRDNRVEMPQVEAPRGVEAVRRVMRELGGVWDVKTLHAQLEERGWIAPDVQHPLKATETALNRLHHKHGEVERVGRGKYRYKGAPDDPNLLTSGRAEP